MSSLVAPAALKPAKSTKLDELLSNMSPYRPTASLVAPAAAVDPFGTAPQWGHVDRSPGKAHQTTAMQQAVVSPFKLPSSLLHAAEIPQSPSCVPASPEAACTASPSSHLLAARKPPRSTTLNPAKFVQRCSQQPYLPVNQHQHSPILNQSKPVGDQSRPASSLLSPARPGVHSASQMTSPPHSRAKMLPQPSPLGRTTGPASCEALDSAVGQQTAPPMPSPAPVLPAEHTAAVCATSQCSFSFD